MVSAAPSPPPAAAALHAARPRLHPSVHVEPRADGSALVVRTQAGAARPAAPGGACDVSAAEARALVLFDGERDLPTLLRDLAAKTPPLRPAAALGLLQRLLRQGLLVGIDSAVAPDLGSLPTRRPWLARLQGLLLLRLPLPLAWPAALRGPRNMAPWAGAALLACVIATLALLPDGADRFALDPFRSGDVAAEALLLYAAAALLASVRGVDRAMTLAHAGRSVGLTLALTYGLLHLDVDDTQRRRLGRAERIRLYLAGIAALAWPTALALAYARVQSLWPNALPQLPPLLSALAVVAPYLLLTDLAPYGRGDGWNLAGAVTGVPDLRRRSAAFLLRRSIANLRRGGRPSQAERTYLSLGTAWLGHGVLTAWLLTTHLLPSALNAVVELARSGDVSPLRWAVAMATASGLVALVVGLGAALCAILGAAVWQVAAGQPGQRSPPAAPAAPLGDAVDVASEARTAMAAIPLFAGLGEADRVALTAALRLERWPAGGAIVRQGEPGDRFCLLVAGEAKVVVEEESGLRHEVARLRAGDFFGEVALLQERPRSATVLAEGRAMVAALGRDRFLALVGESGEARAAVLEQVRNAAAIRAMDGFAGLGSTAIGDLLASVKTLTLAAGQSVLQQDAVGSALYLVRSGSLRVERREGEHVHVLDHLGAGEVCGEFALVSGEPRTASAIVEQDAVLIEVPADALDAAIIADPRLGVALYEAMARRRLAHGGG